MPEHEHRDQWGVVLEGEVNMTIGGTKRNYRQGETYFVPAGVPHIARVRAGTRGIDVFAERDRYRPGS